MTNNELTIKLKDLVKSERKITSQILKLLCEVEKRRLFAELSYTSLIEYCCKELGYSESAANRRISAMRDSESDEYGGWQACCLACSTIWRRITADSMSSAT